MRINIYNNILVSWKLNVTFSFISTNCCISLLLTRVLGLPQSIKLTRHQTRNTSMALLGSLRLQGEVRMNDRFPCLLPEVGWAGSLHGVTAGSGSRGELRCSAHPLGGARAGIMRGILLLFWASQKWTLGFGVLYLIRNLPQLPMHAVIFSPLDHLCCYITSSNRQWRIPCPSLS